VIVLDDTHRGSRTQVQTAEDGEGASPGEPGEHDGSVHCPFCDATTVSMVAAFGSQLLMSQFRCGACRSYFEGVRLDRYEASEAGPPAPAPKPGVS
jgi:hypothetical protein